jgi:HTH-type transcriptional regulator, sugar sensing transcriptional regulator
MDRLDLTPFGFTPTESLVYEVLLTGGPGTGYAIARAAGLARANAYSALEGLVSKGAARSDGGRPRRYRPEDTTALIAKIANDHGQALDRLSAGLEALSVPSDPTIVEIDSPRAALQLISHDVARAKTRLSLLAPAEAYPLLAPALRRPASMGVELTLLTIGAVELPFAPVTTVSAGAEWPGTPLVCVVDDRSALLAYRNGNDVHGHWSTAPALVAAARLTLTSYQASA